MLQRHQAAEELLVRDLGGRQDDAGLQKVLHPPQQVLAALGQVGIPAKDLQGGPGTGAQLSLGTLGCCWAPARSLSIFTGMGHHGDIGTGEHEDEGGHGDTGAWGQGVGTQRHGDKG